MNHRTRAAAAAIGAALLGMTSLATPGQADSDACRDWRVEHGDWKIEALQAFLRSRPRAAQDETMFEVLQREAYLTSCDPDLRVTRSEMVGWRVVGRSPDESPVVLVESVLVAGGFDIELRRIGEELSRMDPRRPRRRRFRGSLAQQNRLGPVGSIDRVDRADGLR